MTMTNDAITTRIRPLDLEAVDNTLYEPKYEELTARQAISLKTDIPAGAETYAYNIMTRSGVAKILANNADDVPLVDLDMRREFQRIYSIVTGFSYTVQELRAAAMVNMPVDPAKAAVARRAVAEKENRLVWAGDDDYAIKGIVNTVGIQVTNVPNNAAGTSKLWSAKTPAEILKDIRILKGLITVLPGQSNGSLTLALPVTQFEALDERYSDYDSRTLREVINSYGWFKRILRVADLKGKGTAGTDSMLIFDGSPEVVQLLLPMDMIRHDPEWKFPRWKIAVEERCGGVIVRYPMAIARGDGI
jgi:hypothetical protein